MQGEYPYLGPTGILDYINEYRIDGSFSLIGEDGDHFLKFREKPMTVFFSGRANVNNHAHIIGDSDECLAKWFYYYYMFTDITPSLSRQGVGRYKLTKANLEKLPIILPPLGEQARIVSRIDAWEEAISATESLIAATKQRNQALLQKLLTGKSRLPGFKKPWSETHIRSFLSESRIPGSDGSSARKLTVKLYGNGVVPRSERIVGSDNTKYYRRKAGQFIYGKLDFLNGAFGIIPASLDTYESTLDLPAFDFSPGINPDFFLSFVGQTRFYAQFSGSAEGGRKARRIQVDEFLNASILVPDLREQAAIAKVLGAATQELALLTAKKIALENQKKALMAVLLTGKKRINA